MKKLLILIALLIPMVCGAEPDPPAKAKVTVFVKSKSRVSKNVIMVFDCSTSMGEDNRFMNAVAEVKNILGRNLDDGMFSLYGFKTRGGVDTFAVWPGIPEKGCPKQWALLPSLVALKSANEFLNNVGCDSWTNVFPAIQRAFTANADKDKLTVILFSDGNNTYPNWQGEKPSSVAAKIKALQKARTKSGKGIIQIFVIGVGVNQNVKMLSAIARAGGGSYITTEKVCQKCIDHKPERADMQQLHESEHVDEAPELEDPPFRLRLGPF